MPPAFQSAALRGTALTVTFDEDLAAAANLANEAFTVRKTPWAGFAETVALSGSPSIDGRTVTLTLAGAVLATDINVEVSYAKPAGGSDNKLKDATDNEVADFAGRPVANDLDMTRPTFYRAGVRGAELTVTFDENLDPRSAPAGSAFTVSATSNEGERAIAGEGVAAIDGDRATVSLASPVAAGEGLRVSYAGPATSPLQDAVGNGVEDFGSQPAGNGTGDGTAPILAIAAVNGARVMLGFSEVLDAAAVPAPAQFTVSVAGSGTRAVAAGGVAVDGKAVTLALAGAVAAADTVSVRYTRPASGAGLRDAAGNQVETSTASGGVANRTGDTTPLADTSAYVERRINNMGPSIVELRFDGSDLWSATVPARAAFTVNVDGVERTPEQVTSSSGSNVAVRLAVTPPVTLGQAVSVSYAQPASRPLRDDAGNAVPSFSGARGGRPDLALG